MKSAISEEYIDFLNEIKSRIVTARVQAIRSVNKELIKLYWDIGKTIVQRQKKYRWGDAVVVKLANDLKEDFKTTFGFSTQNLWYMRQFYLEYKEDSILQQLVGELPWGHNILIFSRIKNKIEREYYLKSSAQMGWSRNVLLNQIKAGAYHYQKSMLKQHNFSKALPVYLNEQADESIKSVYNLDFLDITKSVVERELERRLVEKIKRFMLALGKGFSFLGHQYRLALRNNEYFVDLLFFNRVLKCLVAVELKTGKFEPEYAGKMDFYLQLLDEQIKLKDENPSIGIILCAAKDNIVVEYALRSVKKPIGVAEYYLTNKLPKYLAGKLPDASALRLPIREELR
ncbi:MAG: PDDEXK nuclease domain-containing protein [Candidatus Omnitrophica bacterium]|nr:PDDEXK nuclease domain-containing protein [Candidatus Omnitrophota bacterium]